MRILKQEISDRIYKNMGVIDSNTLENSAIYNKNLFSVFDHCLTNEEARDKILFYQDAIESKSHELRKEYFRNHDRFVEFYLDLYNKTKVYRFFYSDIGPNAIVEFDSLDEFKSHVLLNVREQLFSTLILPEYYSVLSGNFDLVHCIYNLKLKKQVHYNIYDIIKSHKLHILKKRGL